jgi:hypothetical protein
MVNSFMRLALCILILVAAATVALSQPAPQASKNQMTQGSITGRVTIEGKPAMGLRVLLIPDNNNPTAARHALNIPAVTDEEGRFRLTGVPAGVFTLTVAAAAYVFPDSVRSASPGRTVILQEGEEIKDVDLALKRGGIITGRVLDANGQPVIGERLSVQALDETNRKRRVALSNQSGETDDRGIYRLYGLSAGRYIVSIGRRPMPGSIQVGPGGNAPVTYYPGVVDESKATPVSVQINDEVQNVDITLGRPSDAYSVSGRVVDVETGHPVPNIKCGYVDLTNNRLPGLSPVCKTNDNGLFRLERVSRGRYALFISSDSNSEFYSEPMTFEVSSGDVQGLEIKARRGSAISGVAVVEGVKDPAILSQLSRLKVYVMQPDKMSSDPPASTTIAPDGSFHLSGVPPGRATFMILSYPRQDFSLLRVEQNGVEQARGIEVAAGESISGIRLILTYGKGSIRGRIKIQNGTLPEGSRSSVGIALASMPGKIIRFVDPDLQGEFIITDIPAGDYELTVRIMKPVVPGVRPRPIPPIKQLVTVKNSANTEVTVVLDLARMK